MRLLILFSCNEKPKPVPESTQDSLSIEEKEAFLKKGKSIAMATFSTLSAELGKALETGGVSQAVEVCNLAAMPLVDSLVQSTQRNYSAYQPKNTKPKKWPDSGRIENPEKLRR